MSAVPICKPRAEETADLLRELVAEVKGLRADLRRRNASAPALEAALRGYFGEGHFTAGGLLKLAEQDPHGAIALALAEAIDMNAPPRSRSTQLGALLSRMPELVLVADSRGYAVYALRTYAA